LERGCVEDQPQQLRKTGLLNMPDALEPFIVLRLVLCTQPRSGGQSADAPVALRVLGLRIAMLGIKSCHRVRLIYTGQVRLNWNLRRLAMLVFFALAGAGCSGINTGTSVSPATFFLPGLMKADPPSATNAPVAVSAPFQQLAQAW
jgi:hypothetical protein